MSNNDPIVENSEINGEFVKFFGQAGTEQLLVLGKPSKTNDDHCRTFWRPFATCDWWMPDYIMISYTNDHGTVDNDVLYYYTDTDEWVMHGKVMLPLRANDYNWKWTDLSVGDFAIRTLETIPV